jgi:hypothetical protein
MIFWALPGMSPTTKLSCAVQMESVMELESAPAAKWNTARAVAPLQKQNRGVHG